RITSRSSIESAPTAIPATIEVTFPTGFAPVDATGSPVIFTLSATRSDNLARSATCRTATTPAHDTRFSPSNRTVAHDHLCNNLTESAFRSTRYESFDNPHHRRSEGTFLINAPTQNNHSSVDPG